MNHSHAGHGHDHHDHHHHRTANRRRLLIVLALSASYCVAEAVGGYLTNSLSLLADAGHMLSDVAALALSWFAAWIAERPANPRRTYGYYRAEILAALANATTLIVASLLIFIEAARRAADPPAVEGSVMLAIAAGGLLVNLASLWILSADREANLNVRGAWLHVLTDALGSVGAMAAGAAVWWLRWNWADPLVSVVIGLLVMYSSWRLLAESVSVLMESAPRGIDVDEVRAALLEAEHVAGVHDLHVWSITADQPALSVHVVAADSASHAALLPKLTKMIAERFGIAHVTIQIEAEACAEELHP